MVDVAAAAGVSRQTLYDEFGSRQGLVEAYVASETERFLAMVDGALASSASDPRAAVRAAMETFLTAAEAGGLLRAIVTYDGNHDLLALITTHGEDVLDAAASRLAQFFTTRWPCADPEQVAFGSRCLVRLALSFATRPDGAPAPTAAAVAELLGPFLEQMIGRVDGPHQA